MSFTLNSSQEEIKNENGPMFIESLGFRAQMENDEVSVPVHNVDSGIVGKLIVNGVDIAQEHKIEQCSCTTGIVRVFGQIPHQYAVVKCKNSQSKDPKKRCYAEWS